ncbi:ester hydrolase C11orf54 homolog [Centruroides vittatus]|uniref:ester hydrolase C11orf54 homolog n=1 Tax=Centruroides vittatus TaxID=120091 RepID=UPI00350F4F7F
MASVQREILHVPPLQEICQVLQNGLRSHFEEVEVTSTRCPNLQKKPFLLAAEGLCGSPRLADVGGVPNLIPLAQKDKVYNFPEVAKQIDLPDAFIIGAGAGPCHYIGVNSELMPNIKNGKSIINKTHFAKVAEDGSCDLQVIKDNTEFCLMGNLFASEGKPGEVVKIFARKRIGSDNFVTAMRKILASQYKEKSVGMGGVFLINKGKAKLHVMPDFSTKPLNTDEDVDNWLKFYNMNAPLICLSTFISFDPGLDLRVEHTHCFSEHGEGGHYHTDTTPEEAEYLAYYNIAEYIYRIDPPSQTHSVGRN